MSPPAQPHRRMHDAAVDELRDRADRADEETAELFRAQNHNDKAIKGLMNAVELLTQQGIEMRAELNKNTEITEDIRALLTTVKTGLKVLGWLGTGLKWSAGVGAAIVTLYGVIYAATHGGEMP